jgi:hypothetical protein
MVGGGREDVYCRIGRREEGSWCLEGGEGQAGLVHADPLVAALGSVPHHAHVLLVAGVQASRHHLALHVLVVHVALKSGGSP